MFQLRSNSVCLQLLLRSAELLIIVITIINVIGITVVRTTLLGTYSFCASWYRIQERVPTDSKVRFVVLFFRYGIHIYIYVYFQSLGYSIYNLIVIYSIIAVHNYNIYRMCKVRTHRINLIYYISSLHIAAPRLTGLAHSLQVFRFSKKNCSLQSVHAINVMKN